MSNLNDALVSYNQVETPTRFQIQHENPTEFPLSRWENFLRYINSKSSNNSTNSQETNNFLEFISDNSNNSDNQFWYYSAKPYQTSDTSTTSSNNLTRTTKDNNANYAFKHFVKNGIPKVIAAGIVANLYHENLGNPEQTISDSRGTTSYGIACFNSKGELNNLRNFAKANGLKDLGMDTQLNFLTYVAKTRLPELLRATTPEDASFIFGRDFEKFAGKDGKGYKNPDDPEHIRRKNTAKKLYNQYKS